MGADTAAASGAAPPATTRASGRKRKHAESAGNPTGNKKLAKSKTLAQDTPKNTQPAIPPKKARLPKPTASSATEKRLRRFRPQPPKSFADLHARATTQRFYVLSRVRNNDDPSHPEETVELTGSTGNIYTVTVARQPACDCPHARDGNQCKHVVYVLARVLRAKFEYVYQLALLGAELREIFEGAPSPLADNADGGDSGRVGGGKRKPMEGDCPICFGEMDAATDDDGGEPVVWCRAACGQNVHKGCFETWAATKRRQAGGGGGEVTCPYCRSVWEGDEDMVKTIRKGGKRNAEGYVNVADQLGISTQRDYSTYSRWWSGHPSGYRRRY
ncbi:E3 ubiquitin-protein ligase Zswim2 [Parachaetomium inaequale]|uniref:E3 ubiquitin-protein ligase Zswim2 n=1 Tax=Parachaetomium inaequale TaxID=2588326 RepID=A0AAN6SRC5_9PEZI|nr:E3 ubiquitin-protein ligase Zswim2 [Parachaetomium inaequale]